MWSQKSDKSENLFPHERMRLELHGTGLAVG
jgi:hypothetical protein